MAQVSEEMGIRIINGAVSSDHLHIFVEIPPHVKVSEYVKNAKGRSFRRIQKEYPDLSKRYWGCHLWARGYFSSSSGNITDDMINEYINKHSDANKHQGVSNISLD